MEGNEISVAPPANYETVCISPHYRDTDRAVSLALISSGRGMKRERGAFYPKNGQGDVKTRLLFIGREISLD